MQKIAAEMNLSETAFVKPADTSHDFSSAREFKLRWFTPRVEVPLCGHATLATAAVLFHVYDNLNETVEFDTLSGCLKARRHGQREITLDFPVNNPEHAEIPEYKALLGATLGELAGLVIEVQYQEHTKKLVVRLPDYINRDQLERLQPDFLAMQQMGEYGVRGVIVTVRGDDAGEFDFYSRYFAPWVGINEDPVTGSAHTVLASYWANVLKKKSFHTRQCSPRGGTMKVELDGDRVYLTGETVLMMEAQFLL